jgi:Selenophosphate synthase
MGRAMNIVCFPQGKMPSWVLQDILRGGRDAVLEAGAAPAGATA